MFIARGGCAIREEVRNRNGNANGKAKRRGQVGLLPSAGGTATVSTALLDDWMEEGGRALVPLGGGGVLAPTEREGTVSGSLSGVSGERIYGRLRNRFINRWAESRKKSGLR